MPLDIDDGYKKIKKEVTTKQKYNQVKKDIKQLEKKAGDSFEDWGGGLESKFGKFANKQLTSAEKAKQKFQKDFKTQFDQMLEIKFLTQKNGDNKATKYLKKTFVTAIEQIKPQIFDIVSQLVVNRNKNFPQTQLCT
jgi:transketolase